MHQTYVGSQPIYNKELEIHAYQLLFRNSNVNHAMFRDPDQATSELILHSLTDIGLDKLVGKHKASIKFTRNFLVGEYPIPRLKHRIIIELQDNIEVDEDILRAMDEMAEQGYTLSMTEELYLKYFANKPDYKCIVKFDIKKRNLQDIEKILNSFENENIRTLAEKVETQEDFLACNQIGFDYFGGFFLCEPQIVKGQGIPANKIQLIRLIHKLQDEDTSAKELEELITSDVPLSLRLLRYANSSHMGINTRVESIQHAASLLGQDTVRMIATLISLSNISDKPRELFMFGLIRAKMCEQLASAMGNINQNMAFTAGLLSIIDALLDTPIEEVLAKLPLNETLTMALLSNDGELGHLLHDAIVYINNKVDEKNFTNLTDNQFTFAYVQTLMWVNTVSPLLEYEPKS